MLGWLRLASHLHLPLQVVMSLTTSTEYYLWMEYLDNEDRKNSKQEYYLAQIALEVRRNWAKNPNSYKLDDFLFKVDKKPPVKTKEGEADVNLDTYKNFWFVGTGYKQKIKENNNG